MANEIRVNGSIYVNKGSLVESCTPGADTIDMAATGLSSGIQNIGTSAEQITTTEVGTIGWAFFQNLDTTNYVTIGPDSGGNLIDFVKLKPGEFCLMRLMTGITIKAKANTAACELLYKIFED